MTIEEMCKNIRLLTRARGSGKVEMESEEIARQWLAAYRACEALYDSVVQLALKIGEAMSKEVRRLMEYMDNLLDDVYPTYQAAVKELARLAEEGMAEPDGREWQRDREREAIPREQARAAARYKAHRSMMAEHKARQHLRRRKYRSGANAGWY